MKVAATVDELITRAGVTKAELSRRSGISRALIDDYLKGQRQPSVAQLERLGEAVGLRLDLAWSPVDVKPTPRWARPHPSMDAPPLTVADRAKVLELVVGVALTQQRRPRAGSLDAPPFRQFGKKT